MITRGNRFHGYGSLNYLFKRGRSVRSFYLVLRVTDNKRRDDFRCAVIVAKKVAKHSPERNRIRRRIYEIVRAQSPNILPGHDLAIIVYDAQAATAPPKELEELVVGLLKRGKLLKRSEPKTV